MFASFFDFTLAVFCMYMHITVCTMYKYFSPTCTMYMYVLLTYVGPGCVEIVDVKVFVEEERSRMKVTLRKVRLLL